MDPPAWQPSPGYAAWTYKEDFPGSGNYHGCCLQKLSADVAGGTNNVIAYRTLTNFDMCFLRTSEGTIANIPTKDCMYTKKVTPKTTFGYTLRANKATNRWFTDDWEDTMANIGDDLKDLGSSLSRLHFHQERYDLKREREFIESRTWKT